MNAALTLVRGHPGSGKTTWARAEADRTGARHLEADDWRQPPGKPYFWTAETNKQAHEWVALEALRWLRHGVPVIVANTFTTRAEIDRIEAVCGRAHKIVRLTGAYANTHGVPDMFVRECIQKIEPIDGEIVIFPECGS